MCVRHSSFAISITDVNSRDAYCCLPTYSEMPTRQRRERDLNAVDVDKTSNIAYRTVRYKYFCCYAVEARLTSRVWQRDIQTDIGLIQRAVYKSLDAR